MALSYLRLQRSHSLNGLFSLNRLSALCIFLLMCVRNADMRRRMCIRKQHVASRLGLVVRKKSAFLTQSLIENVHEHVQTMLTTRSTGYDRHERELMPLQLSDLSEYLHFPIYHYPCVSMYKYRVQSDARLQIAVLSHKKLVYSTYLCQLTPAGWPEARITPRIVRVWVNGRPITMPVQL